MKLTLFTKDTSLLAYIRREFVGLEDFIEIEYRDVISPEFPVLPYLVDDDKGVHVGGGSVESYLNSLKSTDLKEFALVVPAVFEEDSQDLASEKQSAIVIAASKTVAKIQEYNKDFLKGNTHYKITYFMKHSDEHDEKTTKLIDAFKEYEKSVNRKKSKDSIKPYEVPDLD